LRLDGKEFFKKIIGKVSNIIGVCGKDYKIVAILPGKGDSFWDAIRKRINRWDNGLPKRINIEIESIEGYNKYDQQINIMNKYLKGKLDAAIIGPTSSSKIVPAIKKYNINRVPIVLVDSKLRDVRLQSVKAEYNFYVGSKNRNIGEVAANIVSRRVQNRQKVRICVVGGNPGHQTAIARRRSFVDNLRNIDEDDVEIRDADWERSTAASVMRFFLNDGYPDAVFAMSGAMTVGAIDAIKAARIYENHNRISEKSEQWPVVVGVDAMDTVEHSEEIQLGDDNELDNCNTSICYSINQQPKKIANKSVIKSVMCILEKDTTNKEDIKLPVINYELCAPCIE